MFGFKEEVEEVDLGADEVWFDQYVLNLVDKGLVTGRLPPSRRRLSDFQRSRAEFFGGR